MRQKLFCTTAALALIAGMGTGIAQTSGQNAPAGGERGTQQQQHQAPSGAPAQRSQQQQNQHRDSNTGQAQRDRDTQPNQQREPNRANQNQREPGRQADPQRNQQPSGTQGRAQRDGNTGSVNVQVTDEQRTRIRQHTSVLRQHHVDRVDFDVRVGTRVPRTVTVYDLPREVVEIVPAYRRYKYIMVGDEIVIVDPATLEIVAVWPA